MFYIYIYILSINTKKSGTTSFSRLTAWHNLANWSIRLFDMSWRSVFWARFSREIGPAPEWTSRRKRTRHTWWRVYFAACNCAAITAVRNLPSVWSAVSLSHTRARNCMDGHVSAKLTRILLPFYDWLISDMIDFPESFTIFTRYRCRRIVE